MAQSTKIGKHRAGVRWDITKQRWAVGPQLQIELECSKNEGNGNEHKKHVMDDFQLFE